MSVLHAKGASIRRPIFLFAFLLSTAVAAPALAFDYVEHLWFTDDACRRTQQVLAGELPDNPQLMPAYLALALACPVSWEAPYCDDGKKRARGLLNVVEPTSDAYSATLGDLAALGDHVSRQGPIRNLPRARNHGLVQDMLRWLTGPPRGLKGPIGAVASSACKTGGLDDFDGATRDVDERLSAWWRSGEIATVPSSQLRAVARSSVRRGPHDPAMKYSFDNPHYLDLVLRNHHHFGDAAHDAWNGFHGAATQMTARTCADLIVVDASEARRLAAHVPGYQKVSWGEYTADELSVGVCAMLAEVVRGRVGVWSAGATPELTAPIADVFETLDHDPRLADRIVVHLLSLVFEGTGLHYLQDGLAAGHMRTIRSREALVEVRHDHDEDNRDGVAAVIETATGSAAFVAWGDGYLLSRAPAPRCDWDSSEPNVVSACLLAHQRGIIAASTVASLVDWAYGGAAYRGLECDTGLERAVCMGLPLRAPRIASTTVDVRVPSRLIPGTLPVPPPDFSFESFSLAFGYAPWTESPSIAMRFAAFQEMDIVAHWLRSWQVSGQMNFAGGAEQSVAAALGFGFHYRFYARVMLDLIPVAFLGVRDFEADAQLFAGMVPRIGLTFLPEGWLKIPMEFSLYVDQPIVFLGTDSPAFSEVGDTRPRAMLGFGLAYMH